MQIHSSVYKSKCSITHHPIFECNFLRNSILRNQVLCPPTTKFFVSILSFVIFMLWGVSSDFDCDLTVTRSRGQESSSLSQTNHSIKQYPCKFIHSFKRLFLTDFDIFKILLYTLPLNQFYEIPNFFPTEDTFPTKLCDPVLQNLCT